MIFLSSCGYFLNVFSSFDSDSSESANNQGDFVSKITASAAEAMENSGRDARAFFIRPKSGDNFSISVADKSDIWYIFTNCSGKSILRPDFSIDNSYQYSNLKDMFTTKSIKSEIIEDEKIASVHPELPSISIEGLYIREIDNDNDYGITTKGEVYTSKADFLDDYTGKQLVFNEYESGDLTATCVLTRIVDTIYGKRKLVIYEENGMKESPNRPTASDYNLIADAFLKDGLDNDIYDKVTGLFGNDWGYNNSTFLANNSQKSYYRQNIKYYLIPEDDTITLLYCDIANQGDPENSYVGGYYFSANNFKKFAYRDSNERNMITLHAFTSAGEYLGEGLTTLSHEFQHLIHDQYFNSNLSSYGFERPKESSSAITECFSSIAESYTAQFIYSITGKETRGPFYVGYRGNDTGFLTRNSNANALIGGRAPYYLDACDKYDVEAWSARYDNNDLEDYGLVASLGAYILTNYGPNAILGYNYSSKADLDGIAEAISNAYLSSNMTKEKLIANWGTTVLLSKLGPLASPYASNKFGYYEINGMKVPSINYYNYTPYPNVVENYYNNVFGIQSLDASKTELLNNTNSFFMVKKGLGAGMTYSSICPELDDGVILTVVAVPSDF